MPFEAELLSEVQKAAKVSLPQLAGLLGLQPSELEAVEQGQVPDPRLLADCARLLGVPLEDLLAKRFGPLSLLYRALSSSAPTLKAVGEDGTALTLGGYIQDLRQVDDVERLLGVERPELPPWATYKPISTDSHPPHGANDLAQEVRRHFGLGLEPIPSVWQLANDLGVRAAAVTPDEFSSSITGVSWRTPTPSLLVNLVGGAGAWWSTRMTVAHELCHVLFDLPALGVVVSGDRQGRLYELFSSVDQRANAFAAYLLVPPEAVRGLVGSGNPADAGFVRRISARFQVSTYVRLSTTYRESMADPDEWCEATVGSLTPDVVRIA